MLAFMLMGLVVSCKPTAELVPWASVDVRWWPHEPPLIKGGEVALNTPSVLDVAPVPEGSEVHLYVSRVGEGDGPCTLPAGLCANIVEPELFATTTAPSQGQVRFQIDGSRFPEAGAIAWQALVLDPELEGVGALTEAIARHVAVPPDQAATNFVEVQRGKIGLENTITSGNTHTGGVAFVDLNNDYWPDLYISNGATFANYLYRNNGDGTFTDFSDAVRKPNGKIECAGVKAADIDNDGDLDLIVPVDNAKTMVSSVAQDYAGGPNLLFVNEGDFTFRGDPEMEAELAGITDPDGRRTSSASVADYDLDGCIDLYLTNWAMAALPAGDNFDRLLHGNCDGTFTDVTAETGVDGKGRDGLVGFWWDADHDRYPELYVGNNSDLDIEPDFEPDDVFYKNDAGTLVEWDDNPHDIGHDAWAAMGVDVGDLDADGEWDMYITDVWMLPPVPHGNALYMGLPGKELTANACRDYGVCFGHNSWPTNFEDFDNDGWIDLWVGSSLRDTPEMLYINAADGSGKLVAHRQQGWTGHVSRAGTTADYDGDGDMDIFLFVEGARPSKLFANTRMDPDHRNETDRHWIEIKLLGGSRSNRAAIGAVARLTAGGVPLMRRVTGGDSAHSHRMLTLHFGLGATDHVDEIEITWPNTEQVQVVRDLAADRFWLVDEELGKIEHTFVDPVATYDAGRGELTVRTASNYGGRARLEVTGLGPLSYDAGDVRYAATFDLEAAPTEVEIVSDLGEPLLIAVDP
ncbi:MAG: CRTAC1 family protein [Myxococcales bacterium]|nr:CRTAC1 family protein [Myxococcales bacterium]